jgi:hypothetical protein
MTSAGIVAESRMTYDKLVEIDILFYELKLAIFTHLHFSGQILENIINLILETTRQHFIGFIQHEDFDAIRL